MTSASSPPAPPKNTGDSKVEVTDQEAQPTKSEGSPKESEGAPMKSDNSASGKEKQPKTPRSPGTGTRGGRRQPPPPPDQEAVEGVSQQFMTGKPVKCKDSDLLAVVVRDLEDKRDDLMIKGAFSDSIKAQRAVDAARTQQLDTVKERAQTEVQEDIRGKQEIARQEYDQFKKDMAQQEKELEEELKLQLQNLKNRQMEEITTHDEGWRSEGKQRRFNRTSQKLRILRTQQQLLMNARRLAEAEKVVAIANAEQSRETEENHRLMLDAYLKSRTVVEQRHENELDTLSKAAETRRGEFQHTREISEKRHVNRMFALQVEEEVAQDRERVWIRKHRNDGDQVTNVCGTKQAAKLSRTADVSGFNTLALPPLPMSASPRRTQGPFKGSRKTSP